MTIQTMIEPNPPLVLPCPPDPEMTATHGETTAAAVGPAPKPEDEGIQIEQEIFAALGEPFLINETNGKVELNQRAVAKTFTHARVMQYDAALKQFCRYDAATGRWVGELAERTHEAMAQHLNRLGEQTGHQAFVHRQKEGTINSLVKFARSNDVKPTRMDTDWLFPVANGVLDFHDGPPVLRPHSREYPFRHCSGVHYDPQARCERFRAELLDPALEADDRQLLQTLLGGLLLGGNRAQKILLIRGTSGGGKSTLVSVIEKVLGEHRVAYLRAKNLNGRFETAGFLGRTVLVGKDVPGDTLSEKGARLLKSLTGGDLLEGEIKYQQHRPQMKGCFHVIIVSNNHLRIALDGDELAWERRLVTVEFNREVPLKPIVDLADELVSAEGSGILNWLIEGALRYHAELESVGRITMAEAQRQRVRNLLYNSDSVRAFVEQHLSPTPGHDVSSQELLTAYVARCQQNGWQPVSGKAFLQAVADALASRQNIHQRHDIMRDGGPVRGFKGVALS